MEEREGFRANEVRPHHPRPWGARGPHGGREPLWLWGPRPPSRLGQVASWLAASLARSLGSSARILGIRTLISNPFLDYEL